MAINMFLNNSNMHQNIHLFLK